MLRIVKLKDKGWVQAKAQTTRLHFVKLQTSISITQFVGFSVNKGCVRFSVTQT